MPWRGLSECLVHVGGVNKCRAGPRIRPACAGLMRARTRRGGTATGTVLLGRRSTLDGDSAPVMAATGERKSGSWRTAAGAVGRSWLGEMLLFTAGSEPESASSYRGVAKIDANITRCIAYLLQYRYIKRGHAHG